MFRAKRKDGKGEVKGWLFYRDVKGYKKAFILQDGWTMTGYNDRKIWVFDEIEVIPSTISMKTYQLDKTKFNDLTNDEQLDWIGDCTNAKTESRIKEWKGKMIYGSFNLEGFGMTKGGDVCKMKSGYNYHIQFFGGSWMMKTTDIENRKNTHLYDWGMDMIEIIGKQYDEEL